MISDPCLHDDTIVVDSLNLRDDIHKPTDSLLSFNNIHLQPT